MQGGQKQLDELKAEVASRDRLVSELKVEVEAERTAAEARARELEAGWEQRERQAQAEVAAKVQVRGRVCVCHLESVFTDGEKAALALMLLTKAPAIGHE